MADSFHLTSKARGELANKIKDEIVGWLSGKKRGSDTAAGADSKRQRLDSSGQKELWGLRNRIKICVYYIMTIGLISPCPSM